MPYPFFYGVAMYGGGYYEPPPKPTPPTAPPAPEPKPVRPPRPLSAEEIAHDKMWLNDCNFRAAFCDVAQNITPAPKPEPPKPPTPPPNRTIRY